MSWVLSPGLEAAIRDTHGILNVHIVVRSEVRPPTLIGEVLLDPTGQFHERLGADQSSLVLIRPDGHLGLSCAPPSLETLRIHLERIFLPA
jgi:hypothetical protein